MPMRDENNDDIIIEDDPELSSPKGVEKKLREKLKEAEAKAKEYLDSWQRTQADFVNTRKRDEEAKLEFMKFAVSGLVEDLLPVIDSFELALVGENNPEKELDLPAHGHPPAGGSGNSRSNQVLSREGLEMIYKQLMQVLRSKGLEELNPLGQPFDPKEHESIGFVSAEKSEDDHKVLEVVQKGYILSGKILRPAKVRIGEYIE